MKHVDVAAGTLLRSVLILLLSICSGASGGDEGELGLLRERLEAEWYQAAVVGSAQGWRDSLGADGSWEGIDYGSTGTTSWAVIAHMERIRGMAAAWGAPHSPLRGDAGLREAIGRALEYWFQNDFVNANWWYNVIGVPRQLGPAMLILKDELTEREKSAGLRILERAPMQGYDSQNLVWVREVNAVRGIIIGDADLVQRAYNDIMASIAVVDYNDEGIQPDYSFHQHRRCLYNHGYGASFVIDATRLAVLLRGTRFAMPGERLEAVMNLMLEGSSWMFRNNHGDWAARGRELARTYDATAEYLSRGVDNLLRVETGREAELEAMSRRVRGAGPQMRANRHFWRSDYMVHHRSGYYASVRMYSSRLANTDFNGPENLLGHHLADGAMTLLVRGTEYNSIFPVWDWQRLPGVTARQHPPLVPGTPRRDFGSRAFAGGVSDGVFGVAGFDFERDGLRARKAWFFFDEGIAALGAGILLLEEVPVVTSINQAIRFGVQVPVGDGVWHDSLLYLPLDDRPLQWKVESQSGSWQRINQQQSAAPISRQVFSVWRDHGNRPLNDRYAYWVGGGVPVAQAAAAAAAVPVRVAVNDSLRQAVWHGAADVGGAVLYAAGELELFAGAVLSANRPCTVLVRRHGHQWHIWVASPDQWSGVVEVAFAGGHWRAELPAGALAGSSVRAQMLAAPQLSVWHGSEFERTASVVHSAALGWVNDIHFPYVYAPSRAAWLYVKPIDANLFAVYEYARNRWVATGETLGGWRWDFSTGAWVGPGVPD